MLIVSARQTVDDRIGGLNLGADDYITKPFDLNELVARLHALIRRNQGRSAPCCTAARCSSTRSGARPAWPASRSTSPSASSTCSST